MNSQLALVQAQLYKTPSTSTAALPTPAETNLIQMQMDLKEMKQQLAGKLIFKLIIIVFLDIGKTANTGRNSHNYLIFS